PLSSDVASSENLAVDGMDPSRPGTPYDKLRSVRPTAYPKDAPVQEIRLTLDGDMERYVWFLNNKPLSESDLIRIKGGHIARFIMINRTMMHHPMHLHGHFFRVINKHGEYSPLKHTVDVAPMSTTVIEFYTDEPGDWFFHCHLLYHLKVGMARVLHYDGFRTDPHLDSIRPALFKDPFYSWSSLTLMSNMAYTNIEFSNTRNIFSAELEAGWQRVSSLEWELLFTWDRYFNRFFTAFGGVDLLGTGPDVENARLVAGIRYLLPLNIESRLWVDSEDGARVALGKSLEITPRISVFGEWEYDTHTYQEGRAGMRYLFSKSVSLVGQWHSEFGLGAGIEVRF
ncbi:MAG: copper oxidase, partial [Nitrospirae bacterium]